MQKTLLRVRAVTAFISISPKDFSSQGGDSNRLREKVVNAKEVLTSVQHELQSAGYEVQTTRIATNPFGEYLASTSECSEDQTTLQNQLDEINSILTENEVDFFAVGPAQSVSEIDACPAIVSSSHRISCSAALRSGNDVQMAKKSAECMKIISQLGSTVGGDHVKDGLGNFRFCATANCKPYTPFFPAAMGPSSSGTENGEDSNEIRFAIGLENGKLAKDILSRFDQLDQIETNFKSEMADALRPIQTICENVKTKKAKSIFMGIDTSLNPSLDENGSVAEAIELIDSVQQFGGSGSISAAAEITKALKTLPDIQKVGYCGLMLPVCEDRRLAELASSSQIDTTRLLAISSVCGVGLDTIPVPDCEEGKLTSLILDVGSLSFRYEKSLSCRLLICSGSVAGDETSFNSPYMCECKIFNV